MDLNLKAVIFDMDGVLLDSESICDRTWAMAFEEMGLKYNPNIINLCRGCNKNDTLQILKKEFGEDFDALKYTERTSQLFFQIEKEEGIPLMPYVKKCLEYLSKKYTLALASSTGEVHVKRQLAKAGIIDYFKTLTCGNMVEHSKPEPDIYLKACASIGIKPSECAGIEDSPNGIKSSFRAGLKTIMVPDKIQPDSEIKKLCFKVCKSLKEVMELL